MSLSTLTRSPAEHVTVELLSAYIDQQLVDDEVRQLEAHLADCDQCQRRLEGLQRTATGLKQLKSAAPPPELQHMVARRIALEGKSADFSDHVDAMFSGFQRQSPFLVMFAVIIALAVIILMFSQALQQEQQHESTMIPIIVQEDVVAEAVVIDGREFRHTPAGWIEGSLDADTVDRVLERGSEDAAAFFETHPELSPVVDLPGIVVFRLGEETVKLSASE